MSSIVLTGLASSDPLPGVYLEIAFAAGQVAGDGSPLKMLVLANKSAAGSALADAEIYGPDTATPLQSEAQMIALAGAGSEAHRMFRRMAEVNKSTSVYWLFVTESAGAAASTALTVTGAATSPGHLRVWVGDEYVDAPFLGGDAVGVVASAVASAVNAKTHWPVIASSAAGVVTLTAKCNGARGNDLRVQARVMQGGGVSVSPNVSTALSGGVGDDDNTSALALLKGRGDYYLVSAANDAANLGRLLAHVDTQALPINGNRKRLFAGSVATLANATAAAVGLNAARAELVWQQASDWAPAELAAHCAAIYALEESNTENPRTNFCGYGSDPSTQAIFRVPPPRDKASWPSRQDLVIALNNGLSPIAVDASGARCSLVDRITTRSLTGSVPDYRIRDAHKVTICDFFARDLVAKTALQFSGKRIGEDPQPGLPQPGPQIVTPNRWRAATFALIDRYASNDLLQNIDGIKSASVFQRESLPSTRLSCRIPLSPIDNAKQFAALVEQVA